MDEINQLLKEYLVRLPRELQKKILSGQWLDELAGIRTGHNLDREEFDHLATETALVLFGLAETEIFQKHLETLLPDKAQVIGQAVSQKIFEPLKEDLAAINQKNQEEEELAERLAGLPEEIKTAINSVETAEAIQSIGDKHRLHIDQIGELADEITLVMTGATKPDRFIGQIIKRLHISNELAQDIARETNEKIFTKIKESLQRVQGFEPEEGVEIKKSVAQDLFVQKMTGLFQNKKEEEVITPSAENPPRHDPYKEPLE